MGKAKFYGVAVGRVPGVYASWDDARTQVDAFKGAKHKSFSTASDAERWLAEQGVAAAAAAAAAAAPTTTSPTEASARDRATASIAALHGARATMSSRASGADADDADDADDAAPSSSAFAADLSAAGSFTLFFDGASRGNPGAAGAGAVIRHDATGAIVFEVAEFLGRDVTNNEAEYVSLLRGLEGARRLKINTLDVKGDSKLVVHQVNGEWKVKTPRLARYWEAVDAVKRGAFNGGLTVAHVPREENADADALANAGITVGSSFGVGVNVKDAANAARRLDGIGGGGGGVFGFGGGGGGGSSVAAGATPLGRGHGRASPRGGRVASGGSSFGGFTTAAGAASGVKRPGGSGGGAVAAAPSPRRVKVAGAAGRGGGVAAAIDDDDDDDDDDAARPTPTRAPRAARPGGTFASMTMSGIGASLPGARWAASSPAAAGRIAVAPASSRPAAAIARVGARMLRAARMFR
jgi:ribonuclease HI